MINRNDRGYFYVFTFERVRGKYRLHFWCNAYHVFFAEDIYPGLEKSLLTKSVPRCIIGICQ